MVRGWILLALIGACAAPDLDRATLPYAIKAARDQHRPLIIELGATWCKPCRVFEQRVLTDPRVQEAMRDVIFVRYDVDTYRGRDAQRRTRSRGVPTVLGIDHAGFIRLKKVGTEPTADEFLVFVKQAHAVLGTPADPADKISK
jgi:thiol:disulfide interchange protein